MTEEQKQAVLSRDYNRMIAAGWQHLLSRQDLRHRRPELPVHGGEHDRHDPGRLRQMMLQGGRSPDGNRIDRARKHADGAHHGRRLARRTSLLSARLGPWQVAGAVLGAGVRRLRVLRRSGSHENTPDVVFLVYNDHASAFSLDIIPTFAHRLRRGIRAGR